MAAKKKYKKLTNAEKKLRKELREELRDEGIIPPKKPPLNRRKFGQEATKAFEENMKKYYDLSYIHQAIYWMAPKGFLDSKHNKVSLEQVGIYKMMKLAVEIKKFEEELAAKGENTYNVKEFYLQVVEPILQL
ncbi:MAG: addiction module toxin RelE [Clostridiaceae bacterium]|nr:addiction module toxin RelE [Clostridiaceae bacterium]